mmetsp:Transcript_52764/g.153446  ORF Transcript_52764/g.153446 Transcript_52764/m.153446 type:complete len:384 (+) Transcript_52764:48-1199(+)
MTDEVEPDLKRPRVEKQDPCCPSALTRKAEVLEAFSARLRIDPAGGSFAAFQLVDGSSCSANPLNWDCAVHDGDNVGATDPRPLGHFLCLDRWGPASESEEANGMGYHGEASAVHWQVQRRTDRQLGMRAALPIAGLDVAREVKLVPASESGPVALAFVSECVTNTNKLGRIYNMVQHPSIAPPFLTKDTVVDCNGRRGFAQGPNRTFSESPEKPTFDFPAAISREGQSANARSMTGGDDDVLSYEVDPSSEIGWVTATSRRDGLLLGYVWRREDYPWISLWCSSRGGEPAARGLEFGTTGLHQPFPILCRHPRLLGLPTFEHLDTGESRSRRFAFFLLRVPLDFKGVRSLAVEDKVLTLTEASDERPRSCTVTAAERFFAHG